MIPEMTHYLSKHWGQPSTKNILIDDTHALMSESDFNTLLDYSNSRPSGVYPGKMWKVRSWKDSNIWRLMWYGDHENSELCSNHVREIIIA